MDLESPTAARNMSSPGFGLLRSAAVGDLLAQRLAGYIRHSASDASQDSMRADPYPRGILLRNLVYVFFNCVVFLTGG